MTVESKLHREIGVLEITLNRPASLNALNDELLARLAEVASRTHSGDVGAIVLTGAGRGFCAGADISGSPSGDTFNARQILRRQVNPILLTLLATGKPIVTAVNGVAAGAGIGLALLGDVRLGSEKTVLVPAFLAQGISPDAGVSYLAVRAAGYAGALELLVTAERTDAARALQLGLIDRLISRTEDLLPEALATAGRLAALPRKATQTTIELLRSATRASFSDHVEREAIVQERLAFDDETVRLREVRRGQFRKAEA